MFNSGRLKFQRTSICLASLLAALSGLASMAEEPLDPQQTIVDQRKYEQIAENKLGDGRIVKVLREIGTPKDKAEPQQTIELRRHLPTGQIITIRIPDDKGAKSTGDVVVVEKAHQSAAKEKANQPGVPGRFQVSPTGDTAILVDTETGKTWLLYYPDKRILSRLSEARGNSWKDMPCIWLPLHRPESDAEIQQILARERSLREASEKLRAEEQAKFEEERRKAFGGRRIPGDAPPESKPE